MKAIVFVGDSRRRLRDFPDDARTRAGFELREVQSGREPSDWKAMPSIGTGVRELRIWVSAGTFRVICLAVVDEAVVVLHAFQKKTEKTASKDIAIAAKRLRRWKDRTYEG